MELPGERGLKFTRAVAHTKINTQSQVLIHIDFHAIMRFARTACLMIPEAPSSGRTAHFSRRNFDVSFPMTMVSSSCVTVTLARCFPFSSMVLSSSHLYVPLVVWPTRVVFDVPSFANSR